MKIFGFTFFEKSKPIYECTECAGMPSLVGMRFFDDLVIGTDLIFMGDNQYRTINLVKIDGDTLYTKHHLKIKIKQVNERKK